MTETMQTRGGGQVVKPAQESQAYGLKKYLEGRVDSLAQWAVRGTNPAALIRFALFDYSQSDQLRKCTPESIYLALIACAQVGLEPGALKQEAFIVPFGTHATFMVGWRGLVKLALRSGSVKSIKAHLVYEADVFVLDLGSDERVVHRPALKDRGEIIGAYALARMTNGELEVEWMNTEDLDKIRRSAKRGDKESPAYAVWADQMARKAPIRRLCKRLPLGEDFARAVKLDDLGDSGDVTTYRRVINIDDEVQEPSQLAEGTRVELPAPAAAAPPARGTEAAKAKLAAKRRAAEPAPSAPAPTQAPKEQADLGEVDELELESRALRKALENVFAQPSALPAIRDRIARLPDGPEKATLDSLAKTAARQLAERDAEDDEPADVDGEG